MTNQKLIIAVPKGRILEEVLPVFSKAGITPEKSFFDDNSRQLQFATNLPNLQIIRVRSFDVATFVAFGAAHLGVAGSDVLDEFDNDEIYAPLALGIGKCRMSVAATSDINKQDDLSKSSHIRVATKYPSTTRKFFAKYGIQAECIKLNGAMELAPTLGLCRRIVDLVSTGSTLKANGLVEIEKISDVESYLIVNRTIYKTRSKEITKIINNFKKALNG